MSKPIRKQLNCEWIKTEPNEENVPDDLLHQIVPDPINKKKRKANSKQGPKTSVDLNSGLTSTPNCEGGREANGCGVGVLERDCISDDECDLPVMFAYNDNSNDAVADDTAARACERSTHSKSAAVTGNIGNQKSQLDNKLNQNRGELSSITSHRYDQPTSLDTTVQERMKRRVGRMKQNFICHLCNKSFSQGNNLRTHMTIHTGEKNFMCNICDKKFRTRGSLTMHKRIHSGEKPFECQLCGKRFSNISNLNTHQFTHSNQKPFVCDLCFKHFKRACTLKEHQINIHKLKPSELQNKLDTTYQSSVGTVSNSKPSGKTFTCQYIKAEQFEENIRTELLHRILAAPAHHNESQLEMAHRSETSEDLFSKQLSLEGQNGIEDAQKVFGGSDTCGNMVAGTCDAIRSDSISVRHLNEDEDMTSFDQTWGETSFTTYQDAESDLLETSDIIVQDFVKRHGGRKKQDFVCNVCHKSFAQSSNLKQHKLIHTGEKNFVCDFCDKKFTAPSTLKQHKMTHTGEKPFECDICGKRFANTTHLRGHKVSHSDEKPYVCSVCHKSFKREGYMKLHQISHSDKKCFKCDACNKQFTWKRTLTRHNLTHHAGQES